MPTLPFFDLRKRFWRSVNNMVCGACEILEGVAAVASLGLWVPQISIRYLTWSSTNTARIVQRERL